MKKNKGCRFTIGCLLIGQIVFLPACSVRKQREKSVWRQEETYRLQTDSLFSGGKRRRESESIRQWEMICLSPPTALAGNTYRLSSGAGTPGAAVPSEDSLRRNVTGTVQQKEDNRSRDKAEKQQTPTALWKWAAGVIAVVGESRDSAGSAGISVRRQGRISVLRGRSCRPGG